MLQVVTDSDVDIPSSYFAFDCFYAFTAVAVIPKYFRVFRYYIRLRILVLLLDFSSFYLFRVWMYLDVNLHFAGEKSDCNCVFFYKE